MSDIFISYARSTADQAQQVAEALRKLGYDVWRDDELPAHRAYAEVIEERLRSAKAVVVIWSAEAAKSQWVRAEANVAREAGTLVQLRLDAALPPLPFNEIQCADMTGWAGDLNAHGWKKVAASVAELIGGTATGSAPSPSVRRLSICVLPFDNMSGDPEQEYFSDGISEDIITDLSKVSALGVIARNTAFGFKGKSPNVKEVAHQLGVSHVLEGSVRKAGGRVRISAQLIDGASGEHAWAERYDRELTDIFALQDEISEAIERLTRRAVDLDPRYAPAWALMASSQSALHRMHGRAGDDGQAALERALALNPDLAEARAIKAGKLSRAGQHEEAAAEIAIALRLDPESYEVNYRAGAISYNLGRLEDAVPHFERARALIETEISAPFMLISCYTALGDAENTRRVARIALARAEKAIAQDRSNGSAMETGVGALAALGEAERAWDWMNRALLIDPDNLQMRYNFACALATSLGDPEAALDMLGPVLQQDPGGNIDNAKTDPDFGGLRANPRFQGMMAAAEARLVATKPAEGAGA